MLWECLFSRIHSLVTSCVLCACVCAYCMQCIVDHSHMAYLNIYQTLLYDVPSLSCEECNIRYIRKLAVIKLGDLPKIWQKCIIGGI